MLDGLEVTYLARHDGRQPVQLSSGIGRRLPAFSTATGKAALASLPDDELARRLAGVTTLPRPTRKAHATVDELMADIVEIRRRGYAIDDEQTMEGVVCYGVMVPSRQPGGEGPCAASITLLKVRATAERVPALIADLQRLAARAIRPDPARLTAGRPPRRRHRRRPRARRRQVRGEVPGGRDHVRVRGGEQADRPVGAEEQTPRPERLEGDLDVRRQVVDLPRRRVRLGDEAGQLARHVRELAERAEQARPRLGAPERIGGLARWSMTNRRPAISRATVSAAGSSRGRTRRS